LAATSPQAAAKRKVSQGDSARGIALSGVVAEMLIGSSGIQRFVRIECKNAGCGHPILDRVPLFSIVWGAALKRFAIVQIASPRFRSFFSGMSRSQNRCTVLRYMS
jgi:hypothetical protein